MPNIVEPPATSLKQPSPEEFGFMGCRLCLWVLILFYIIRSLIDRHSLSFSTPQIWTKWQNVRGQTSAIRNHLALKHTLTWEDLVVANRLKGWEEVQQGKGTRLESAGSNTNSYAPFTIAEFHERLIRFVSADDQVRIIVYLILIWCPLSLLRQSIGIVECEEFRSLLEFICPDLRKAGAIPHRTKLSELVTSTFRDQYNSMVSDIEVWFIFFWRRFISPFLRIH